MASNSMNGKVSPCILFNMKEKCEKISNIEVVEEIKYLGVIVQAKRNVFEGQKNEIMKKKNQKIECDDKLCHRKKLPSSNDGRGKHIGKEWCYQAHCMEQK